MVRGKSLIEGEEVKKYYLKLIDEHWTRYTTKTGVKKYLLYAKYGKTANILLKKGIKEIVLDIGCGDGILTCVLAKEGVRTVGLDLSKPAIKVAKEKAQKLRAKDRVDFVVCDAEQTPIRDGSIEAIACLSTLEHVPNPQQLMNEMSRILREKGIAIILVPNAFSLALYDSPQQMVKCVAKLILGGFFKGYVTHSFSPMNLFHRRYLPNKLLKMIKKASLKTIKIEATHIFPEIILDKVKSLLAIDKKLARRRTTSFFGANLAVTACKYSDVSKAHTNDVKLRHRLVEILFLLELMQKDEVVADIGYENGRLNRDHSQQFVKDHRNRHQQKTSERS